ncbi:MAG: radical SAM protein [Candidatus Lokiarchaeota archaeon]|nr:radical SAM protein [Candidatus Lokiarchaeota archaeon]
MEYVFGPVPSRRLGRSLGIDPIPSKTCNFQCIYCQLGRTNHFTNTRQSFYSYQEILNEVKQVLNNQGKEIDFITFVGSGEPTLYKDLGLTIQGVKNLTDIPICVITNGALLYEQEVREEIMDADIILPTLDAGDSNSFIRINRPHPSIKYDAMIKGFLDFRSNFGGKFWIEVMLMKNINDSREELKKIKIILDQIQPDRIDINFPIRPPAEKWVEIPNKEVFVRLDEIFGIYSEIVHFPKLKSFKIYSNNFEKELTSIIGRHPMRQSSIIKTFQSEVFTEDKIIEELKILESQNIIEELIYGSEKFWTLKR